jgi:hypothetical protein
MTVAKVPEGVSRSIFRLSPEWAVSGRKELTSLTRKNHLLTSRKPSNLQADFHPNSPIKDDSGVGNSANSEIQTPPTGKHLVVSTGRA